MAGMRSLLGSIVDKAATVPVPFAPRRTAGSYGGAFGGSNDTTSQMRAMGSVGTLFAIINRTSTATAKADWKLYRKAKSGKPEDRVEVTSHAALDVWQKPNKWWTRQELVESGQQHMDLTGETWLVIGRNPHYKVPVELWCVRPDRMTPVPDADNYLVGYIYTSPDGEKVPLGLDEVMQIRMPNPLDPYRGMGPVQALLSHLDSVRYSAEWNRNFFYNSAQPGGIIEVDHRLGDTEFAELATRWREQHQGVANAHRVAVLEQGKWVNNAFSMRDMQFTELQSVNRELIREAFGMPSFQLGGDDIPNRATADASDVYLGRRLIDPRLDRWKAMLNNDFLPLFGPTADGLEFDYQRDDPEDADAENARMTAQADAAQRLVASGWQGPVVAQALGLPDLLQTGWTAPTVATHLPPPPHDQLRDRAVLPNVLLTGEDGRSRWADLVSGLTDEAPDPTLDGLQADWQQALDRLMAQWDRDVAPEQRRQLAEQIQTAVDQGDMESLADLQVDSGAGAALLTAAMVALAVLGARSVVTEAAAAGVHGVQPHTPSHDDLATAARTSAALLGRSLATAAGQEAKRVAPAMDNGQAVAAHVEQWLAALPEQAVSLQLGGDLTMAQNAGRLETLRHAPAARYYAQERLDKNTCPKCRAINGTELPTLDAAMLAYGGGGYLYCLGGPRCRGTVRVVWQV